MNNTITLESYGEKTRVRIKWGNVMHMIVVDKKIKDIDFWDFIDGIIKEYS